MKIGLLGGAFEALCSNLGHLAVARAVLNRVEVGHKVWFLPSRLSPLQSIEVDKVWLHRQMRRGWLAKALAKEEAFEVKDWDKGDGEVCYTADLLERLPSQGYQYFFIIGEDNAGALSSWHRFQWLLEKVRFVVVARKSQKSWRQLDYAQMLKFVQMDPVDISSAQIRSCPRSYAKFLPKAIKQEVVEFYTRKGLIG